MDASRRPRDKQPRRRGYLASWDGVRKLEEKKFSKNYSYETIAKEAGLASDDQVKRLFHPQWGRRVQLETIEKIARVLDLTPTDIINRNEWSPLDKEPNVDKAKILLSDHSQDTSFAQQLRRALEAAELAVFITEAQFSDEELDGYDCFLLLVSSHSADISNIVMEEIGRVRQLRDAPPDGKPVIMLIHVGSLMSLPLNHALHKELQGIPQREWPQTDISTLVQEVLELLEAGPPVLIINSDDWGQFLQNVSSLNLSRNWLLTYIGEDQLLKLGALVNDLINKGDRRIQSGYSYWGVGPVQMWDRACNDPTYHMRKNISEFPHYAKQLAHLVDKERYNFVSLGVGEGRKDRSIISDFFNRNHSAKPREDFLYIPVDMSLDMLRIAVEKIQETNPLPLHRCVAIQKDIESLKGMQEIAYIAQSLGAQKPILYGFIGNTIANVESPKQVLNNIVNAMRSDDLLLFEAQIINTSALESQELLQETMESVRREYLSDSFRRFAVSALLQNTDLTIDPTEKDNSYIVDVYLQQWKYGQVLHIDCFFENNTDRSLYMTLVNEQTVKLNEKERIRLYRSRKFTQPSLQKFVQANDLSILGEKHYLSEKATGFMVMMLKRQNGGETSGSF
ncbi:L-histidine N(alpha)-methyltransferase [Iningainema tapete]|uniref:L-histidine N(Alpha)-methyltransferase n=1 Tax=Iningainema tapete BLCC-T55 TaxID=2748662 RepID=A0A8J7CAT8_9CYAN|nr:L-histidine N(alpha)-methyltransferase [Iningainema tapete]MBD2777541.1 L-histidine N(alpha)-methyltransferase [Iningainema tapete BLCC-T55]